jgi:hypothetical protein
MEHGDEGKDELLDESSGSPESPEYMISSRSRQQLETILHALLHGSREAKVKAAMEIQKLPSSSSKRKKAYLVASGAIQPLVAMLIRRACPESLESSMQALLSLALRNERYAHGFIPFFSFPLFWFLFPNKVVVCSIELLFQKSLFVRINFCPEASSHLD